MHLDSTAVAMKIAGCKRLTTALNSTVITTLQTQTLESFKGDTEVKKESNTTIEYNNSDFLLNSLVHKIDIAQVHRFTYYFYCGKKILLILLRPNASHLPGVCVWKHSLGGRQRMWN